MLKIMETEKNDECLLAAGEYVKDQIQLPVLDAINQEEEMIKSDCISYFSSFHEEDFQHLEEVLVTGIRLENELFNWLKNL